MPGKMARNEHEGLRNGWEEVIGMRLLKNRKGVTMVEYGLIGALIAVVCVGAITTIGTRLNKAFGQIRDQLPP